MEPNNGENEDNNDSNEARLVENMSPTLAGRQVTPVRGSKTKKIIFLRYGMVILFSNHGRRQ